MTRYETTGVWDISGRLAVQITNIRCQDFMREIWASNPAVLLGLLVGTDSNCVTRIVAGGVFEIACRSGDAD